MHTIRTLFLLGALQVSSPGLIFRDGQSPAANTNTPPTEDLVGSGWQYQVNYRGFFGTAISPNHFITAAHLGSVVTATQAKTHNGIEDRVFHTKGPRMRLGESDLAVFEVWETFDQFAPLYQGSDEPGKEMVIFGRGRTAGTELENQGWLWAGSNTEESRWGENDVDGVTTSDGDDLLYFDFDDLLGVNEVAGAGGDSGGGWFVQENDVWKLAAVSFAVDGSYSKNSSGTGAFRGAFYNAEGLYLKDEEGNWNEIAEVVAVDEEPTDFYLQSHTYGSRISQRYGEISAIIAPSMALAGLTPQQKYTRWLEQYELSEEPGDSDGDGFQNLEEYFSEGNPVDFKSANLPLKIEFVDDSVHRFTIQETLDLRGRGLTSEIQFSTNLVTWGALPGLTETSNNPNRINGLRTRVLEANPPSTGSLYYRLAIQLVE